MTNLPRARWGAHGFGGGQGGVPLPLGLLVPVPHVQPFNCGCSHHNSAFRTVFGLNLININWILASRRSVLQQFCRSELVASPQLSLS